MSQEEQNITELMSYLNKLPIEILETHAPVKYEINDGKIVGVGLEEVNN